MSSDVVVSLQDLHKSFGSNHVLRGIDLEVTRGEVVCIIGPSGSGKSTLLRCVNMLETPSSGTITVLGRELTDIDCDIDEARSKIGMVFQRPNPFPKSIYENVAYGLRIQGEKSKAIIDERNQLPVLGHHFTYHCSWRSSFGGILDISIILSSLR